MGQRTRHLRYPALSDRTLHAGRWQELTHVLFHLHAHLRENADGCDRDGGSAHSRKVRDIDSERMLLRVERSRGGRYRNAMLPTGLLALLREWRRVGWRERVLHVDG